MEIIWLLAVRGMTIKFAYNIFIKSCIDKIGILNITALKMLLLGPNGLDHSAIQSFKVLMKLLLRNCIQCLRRYLFKGLQSLQMVPLKFFFILENKKSRREPNPASRFGVQILWWRSRTMKAVCAGVSSSEFYHAHVVSWINSLTLKDPSLELIPRTCYCEHWKCLPPFYHLLWRSARPKTDPPSRKMYVFTSRNN